MFSKTFLKRYQPALTVVAVVLAITVAFSFAPVRAFAGDLLKIFRVQQVKIVPVDVDRLENLEGNDDLKGLLEQFSPESDTVVDGGEPVTVANLTEAASLVDFTIDQISSLPADRGDLKEINVLQKSVHRVQLDPELLGAIFEAGGIPIDLPDSLKDTPILITRPTMMRQVWGVDSEEKLQFIQLNAPQIEYPDDLDLDELGVAGLQLLGYTKAEALALSATIDWANTLILPLPSDAEMTVTEVTVNGAAGTLFEGTEGKQHEQMLMWQANGKTYVLAGSYSGQQLLEMAESIQ